MSIHRTAARRDQNEKDIVDALRRVGADVRRLSGAEVPDLLVGYRARTLLLGVKRPDGPKGGTSKGRYRHSGDQCPDSWPGGPWVVVTTVAEALEVLGLMAGDV